MISEHFLGKFAWSLAVTRGAGCCGVASNGLFRAMAESESSFEGPADRFELDELEQLVKTQREMLQGLRKQLGCATQSNDHAQKKASYAVQLAQTLQVRAQQAEVDNVRLKAEVASLKEINLCHIAEEAAAELSHAEDIARLSMPKVIMKNASTLTTKPNMKNASTSSVVEQPKVVMKNVSTSAESKVMKNASTSVRNLMGPENNTCWADLFDPQEGDD